MLSRRPTLLALAAVLILTGASNLCAAETDARLDKFIRIFAAPDGGPAAISPDGAQLAYVVREKGEAFLHIFRISDSKVVFRISVGKEDQKRKVGATPHTEPIEVPQLLWVSNDHVVVATSYEQYMAIDARDKSSRFLVDLDGKRYGRIVGVIPGTPPHVVIEAAAYLPLTAETSHVIFTVNVATGAFVSTKENVPSRLIYDGRGVILADIPRLFRDSSQLRRSEPGKDKWVRLQNAYPAVTTPFPVTPEAWFGERTFPVSVDNTQLFFASNVGRDTFGIYSLDLRNGQRTSLALEDPDNDLVSFRSGMGSIPLRWDRATQTAVGVWVHGGRSSTRWLDAHLGKVQQTLESKLRASSVSLVDWDDERDLFIVEIHKRADPGAYYLYTASRDTLQLILAHSSAQKALPRVVSSAWSLPQASGGNLTGLLVVPAEPSAVARPIVVRFQSTPWTNATNYYRAEVMALAQMGYAVLEVNHRGVGGLGRAHLRAGRHHFDEVAAEDVIKAIEGMPPAANLDLQHVAVMGEKYGGYLALRALQLRPGRFACAVTLDPVPDLVPWLDLKRPDSAYFNFEHEMRAWYFGTQKAELRARSPESDPKTTRVPVFLAANPEKDWDNWGEINAFRRSLTAAGNPPTFVEVTDGVTVPGKEKAQLWARIEEFLREHIGRK